MNGRRILPVYVNQPFLLARSERGTPRLLHVGAMDDHVGAVLATSDYLDDRRYHRHDHGHGYAKLVPVIRDCRRVVTARGRDNAELLLLVGQHHQRVPRPALLEASGYLEEILLQVKIYADRVRQPRFLRNRRRRFVTFSILFRRKRGNFEGEGNGIVCISFISVSVNIVSS